MLFPSLSLPQIQPKLRPCCCPAHPWLQVSTPASPSRLSSWYISLYTWKMQNWDAILPHLAWQTALPSLENPRHFFIPLKDDSAAFLLPLDHEFLEGRGCVSPVLISWGPSKIPSTERHPDKSSLNGQIHEREIDCTFSNALCHQCPPFIHCLRELNDALSHSMDVSRVSVWPPLAHTSFNIRLQRHWI